MKWARLTAPLFWLILCGAAEYGCARLLARGDVLASFLNQRHYSTLALLPCLWGLRLFLYFVWPGWALARVTDIAYARLTHPSSKPESSPPTEGT